MGAEICDPEEEEEEQFGRGGGAGSFPSHGTFIRLRISLNPSSPFGTRRLQEDAVDDLFGRRMACGAVLESSLADAANQQAICTPS